MGKQKNDPILSQITANRQRYLADERLNKEKIQKENILKAKTPDSVMDGTDPDYGAPVGFQDQVTFGETREARLDSSRKLIEAELKAHEEAKKQKQIEEQRRLAVWNDPAIQEQFRTMNQINSMFFNEVGSIDPNSLAAKFPNIDKLVPPGSSNIIAPEKEMDEFGRITTKKQKEVSLDEKAKNKVSNFLIDAKLYNKPISENIRGVLDPIVGGKEKMVKGVDEVLSGDVLRGSAHLLTGTLQAAINMIPAVVGLNATMPIMNQIGKSVAEGLGYTKEEGEKVTGLIAPFLFGKWIGASSLVSFGVDEGVKESGILDNMKPEDQIIMRELIGHMAFFGTLLGGKKIQKSYLDPILDNAFPYTRGLRADLNDPKVTRIMNDYAERFNEKKAEFEKKQQEAKTPEAKKKVAEEFNKWASDEIQNIIQNEKPAFFRNIKKDIQNLKEKRRYEKSKSKEPIEILSVDPNQVNPETGFTEFKFSDVKPEQQKPVNDQETDIKAPKTDLGRIMLKGDKIVSPQRSIEAPKGTKPIITPKPGEVSGKTIVTPPAKLKQLSEHATDKVKKYFNSHGKDYSFAEFKDIEVGDRENFEPDLIDEITKKYNLKDDDRVIWVTPDKRMAHRYNLASSEWDKIQDIPNEELEAVEFSDKDGFIIPETDDGDNGFLMVLKKPDEKKPEDIPGKDPLKDIRKDIRIKIDDDKVLDIKNRIEKTGGEFAGIDKDKESMIYFYPAIDHPGATKTKLSIPLRYYKQDPGSIEREVKRLNKKYINDLNKAKEKDNLEKSKQQQLADIDKRQKESLENLKKIIDESDERQAKFLKEKQLTKSKLLKLSPDKLDKIKEEYKVWLEKNYPELKQDTTNKVQQKPTKVKRKIVVKGGSEKQQVVDTNISDIVRSEKDFQGRHEAFSGESFKRIVAARIQTALDENRISEDKANRIIKDANEYLAKNNPGTTELSIDDVTPENTFSWNDFGQILLWQDPEKKLNLLSGHSRMAASEFLSKYFDEFKSIPSIIEKNISFDEAQKKALQSNIKSTSESLLSHVKKIRTLIDRGKSDKEIKAIAKTFYGPDANKIINMSKLNPEGFTISSLKLAEKDPVLNTIGNWIGNIRSNFPQLTNEHENELFSWLTDYNAYGKIVRNMTQLNELIDRRVNRIDFNPDEPLNLKNAKAKGGNIMQDYERELADKKQELNNAKLDLDKAREKWAKAGYEGDKLSDKIQNESKYVNRIQKEYADLLQKRNAVINAEMDQGSLFEESPEYSIEKIENDDYQEFKHFTRSSYKDFDIGTSHYLFDIDKKWLFSKTVLQKINNYMVERGYDYRGYQDTKRALEGFLKRRDDKIYHKDMVDAIMSAANIKVKENAKQKKYPISNKEIFQDAIDYFGITDSPIAGRYMLPNGDLLSLGHADHREISIIGDPEYNKSGEDYDIGMDDFIDLGAIRMNLSEDLEDLSLDMNNPPTIAQWSKIDQIVSQTAKLSKIYIDINNGARRFSNVYDVREYDGYAKLQDDVKHFYRGGTPRKDFVRETDEIYNYQPKVIKQINSSEFKKWFADSKIVDGNGIPKVMYHGTGSEDFNVFKKGSKHVGGPIFVAEDPAFANAYTGMYKATGDIPNEFELRADINSSPRIYPLYVKASNPFDYENKSHVDELMEYFKKNSVFLGWKMYWNSEAKLFIDRNLPASIKINKENYAGNAYTEEWVRDKFESGLWIYMEGNANAFKDLGYDAIYLHESTSKNLGVFEPTQLKSALGNIGTFDITHPSIVLDQPGYSYGLKPGEKNKMNIVTAQQRQITSPQFKQWFGDSKVVDANGNPLIVYHGTTHNIDSFSLKNANVEGHFGNVFYFSDKIADINDNYANTNSPDLTSRISRYNSHLVENVLYEIQQSQIDYNEIVDLGYSGYVLKNLEKYQNLGVKERLEDQKAIRFVKKYEKEFKKQSEEIARKKFMGEDANILPVYLRITNPVIINGYFTEQHSYKPKTIRAEKYLPETWIEMPELYDIEAVRDEAIERFAEEMEMDVNDAYNLENIENNPDYLRIARDLASDYGYYIDVEPPLLRALNNAMLKYPDSDVSGTQLFQELSDTLNIFDGFTASELVYAIDNSENVYSIVDSAGNLAKGAFIKSVFEELGYDGIILQNADIQFKNMNMPKGTTHYHVFHPNQIKSAIGNNGDYDPTKTSIIKDLMRDYTGMSKDQKELVQLKDYKKHLELSLESIKGKTGEMPIVRGVTGLDYATTYEYKRSRLERDLAVTNKQIRDLEKKIPSNVRLDNQIDIFATPSENKENKPEQNLSDADIKEKIKLESNLQTAKNNLTNKLKEIPDLFADHEAYDAEIQLLEKAHKDAVKKLSNFLRNKTDLFDNDDQQTAFEVKEQIAFNFELNSEIAKADKEMKQLGNIRWKSFKRDYADIVSQEDDPLASIIRRYKKFKQIDFYTGTAKIETPSDVAFLMEQLNDESVEHSFIVHIDANGKPIIQHISTGNFNSALFSPFLGLDLSKKLKTKEIYFVHNHPSGALESSFNDRDLLIKLKQTFLPQGIYVNDGIIIDIRRGVFAQFGVDYSDKTYKYADYKQSKKITAITFGKSKFLDPLDTPTTTSPGEVAIFLSKYKFGYAQKTSVLILNSGNRIVGRVALNKNLHDYLSSSDTTSMKEKFAGDVLALTHQFGGTKAIVIVSNADRKDVYYTHFKDIMHNSQRMGGLIVDIISVQEKKTEISEYSEQDIISSLALEKETPYGVTEIKNGNVFYSKKPQPGTIREPETPRMDKYIKKVMEQMPEKLSPEKEARLNELKKYKELTPEERAELKSLKEEKSELLAEDPFERHRLSSLIKMKIKNLRTGYKIGAEERQKQLTDLKKEIAAYARLVLPRADYRKSEVTPLLTELAKAKDLDGTAKAFTRIRDLERKVRKRVLISKINKLIRSADRTKGDPDFVIAIKNIRKLKPEDIETEIAKIYERAATRELTDEEDQFLYLLQRFSYIKNKSVDELEDLYKELYEAIKLGRNRRKEWLAKEKERIQDLTQKTIFTITGGKQALSEDVARAEGLDKEKLSLLERLSDVDSMMHSWEWMLDKLSKHDKTTGPMKSFLNLYFGDKIFEARNAEDRGMRENLNLLRNKMLDIYGTSKYKLTNLLNKNSERQDTGAYRVRIVERDEAGLPIKTEKVKLIMSQNEAAYMLMVHEDPQLDLTFEKMGYTEETWNKLKDFVNPKVMRWAKWQLEEFYPNYYKGVNEVYKAMRGVDLQFNKKYMPISRDVSQTVLDQEFLGDNNTDHVSIYNGHLQPRVANTNAIRIQDIDRVLIEHIIEMEHFKAFAAIMKDLRGVFGNKNVSKAIKQYHSKTALQVINRFINDFARGGVDRKLTVGLLDKIRANFAKSVIGLNPVVFIKQLTSIPAYMMEIPVKDFSIGMVDFMLNPIGKTKFLYNNSEVLKSRYSKGWERDIILAMQRARKTTAKELSGRITFTDIIMSLAKYGDGAAIFAGGWSVYKYSLKKELSSGKPFDIAKANAIKEFEKATKRSQQAGDVEDLGEIQRQGSWAKMWTLFKTAPKQYYSNMSGAMRNLLFKRGTRTENLKRIFVAHVLLPQLFQWAANGFNWDSISQIKALAIGSLNGILIAGDILESALNAIMGDVIYSADDTPITAVSQDLYKALKQINKYSHTFDKDIESLFKTIDELASALSKFIGLPYDPVKKVAKGVKDYAEDPTNTNVLRLVGYSDAMIKHDVPEKSDTLKLIQERQLKLNEMKKEARKTMNPDDIEKAKQYEKDLKLLKSKSLDWKKKTEEEKSKRLNDPFKEPKKPNTMLGKKLLPGLK